MGLAQAPGIQDYDVFILMKLPTQRMSQVFDFHINESIERTLECHFLSCLCNSLDLLPIRMVLEIIT